MFKVQRFTADDDEEADGHESNAKLQHSDILSGLLQRAKSRAKRARFEATATHSAPNSRDTNTGEIHSAAGSGSVGVASSREFSVSADGARFGTQLKASGGQGLQGGDGAAMALDGADDAAQEAGESESFESKYSDDSEEEQDSEREESEEPMDTPKEAILSAPEGAALDGRDDVEEGQGLRPVEEVAEEWGLDARLTDTLRTEGVRLFFPIQVGHSRRLCLCY